MKQRGLRVARGFVAGQQRPRRGILTTAVAVVVVASLAFVAGLPVGLYEFRGWLLFAPVLGITAGLLGAGLAPTVGSLWLVALWGYVFPPLMGSLTGQWEPASRYAHPRTLAFTYESVRADLRGGIEMGLETGLLLAVGLSTLTYLAGTGLRWLANQFSSESEA